MKIELILFTIFLILSLILVALGLYRLEHTELSLVGFVFILLLGFVVIGNNLTYQTGETITTTNNYANISGTIRLANFTEVTSYDHSTYQDTSGFFTTHRFGYLLVVLSVVGMIGTFISIKPQRFIQ